MHNPILSFFGHCKCMQSISTAGCSCFAQFNAYKTLQFLPKLTCNSRIMCCKLANMNMTQEIKHKSSCYVCSPQLFLFSMKQTKTQPGSWNLTKPYMNVFLTLQEKTKQEVHKLWIFLLKNSLMWSSAIYCLFACL